MGAIVIADSVTQVRRVARLQRGTERSSRGRYIIDPTVNYLKKTNIEHVAPHPSPPHLPE